MKKYLDIYLSGPFDPLAAMSPKKSAGNRNRRYSYAFEMLVMAAAHLAWQQPKGTWKTHKRIFLNQLKRPEFAAVAIEILDGDGNLRCADITLQRRFYSVDRYTRAILRYGKDAAKKKFDGRTRRPLPEAVLDEVECDYTTLDVNVWSDDEPIAYGRPKIILFRDRKSAVVLGFYIFFGNPSLEAFLNGLHHACYPKDMRAYPSLKYPFYGRPLILIFDNDSHLLTDDVKHFCDLVGIVHRQCRPGEPIDKGAVERLIRVLNDYLLHNLPGSTQSNPTRRNAFDKEKQMGVPQIKLSELEAFVMHFLCGEYHVHPRNGLGITRVMKDIPAEVWKKSILDVRMRPPLNPQTFTMAAGRRREVTIQNGMIRLQHLTYSHPDLAMLETRPKHRAAEPGVETTRYVVYEKTTGIDSVTLIDHFADNRPIEVPICAGDRKYATGKLWYQHEAAVKKYNSWLRKEPIDTLELQRAFDAHMHELDAMHAARNSQKTAEALARFRFDMGKKFRVSRTVEVAHSEAASAAHIDYANPLAPEPVSSASDTAPSDPPATPKKIYVPDGNGNLVKSDPLAETVRKKAATPPKPVETPPDDDVEDDLASLLNKYKGYDQ